MAGDWIKIRHELDDDPHVLRLQRILKIKDIDLLIGKLRRLWKYADLHTVDGKIAFATRETIDEIVRLAGFGAAMEEVGWLEFDASGSQVSRFDEHNSASAKKRCLNTVRSIRRRQRDESATGARPEKIREDKSDLFAAVAAEKETVSEAAPDQDPTDRTPRDALWLAVAKLMNADPIASAANIGRVYWPLRKADPPYTADELLRLPAILQAQGFNPPPYRVGALRDYIGWVRNPPTDAEAAKAVEVSNRAARVAAQRAQAEAEQAGAVKREQLAKFTAQLRA